MINRFHLMARIKSYALTWEDIPLDSELFVTILLISS
jgi:hypothetical protein